MSSKRISLNGKYVERFKGIFIAVSVQIPSEQILGAQGLTLSHSEGHKQRRERA